MQHDRTRAQARNHSQQVLSDDILPLRVSSKLAVSMFLLCIKQLVDSSSVIHKVICVELTPWTAYSVSVAQNSFTEMTQNSYLNYTMAS